MVNVWGWVVGMCDYSLKYMLAEVDVGCLPSSLSILLIETGSLAKSRPC